MIQWCELLVAPPPLEMCAHCGSTISTPPRTPAPLPSRRHWCDFTFLTSIIELNTGTASETPVGLTRTATSSQQSPDAVSYSQWCGSHSCISKFIYSQLLPSPEGPKPDTDRSSAARTPTAKHSSQVQSACGTHYLLTYASYRRTVSRLN